MSPNGEFDPNRPMYQSFEDDSSSSAQSSDLPDMAGPDPRLVELEAKLAEANEAHLRARADAENIRRRSDDEIGKARKFAVESFAESMLPVKDSLEAAVANLPVSADPALSKVLEGVSATLRQLESALERHKVIAINPAPGTRFDPHQHQAIGVVPAAQDPNTVVNVLQKGYLIAERVLRPALVMVSAPPQ